MANTQVGDSQKVSWAYSLFDKVNDLVPLKPGQSIAVVSDSPDSLSVVTDPTPADGTTASGFLVGTAAVKAGVNVTFSALDADGTTKLVADIVDTLDVVVGAAVTASVSLGTPVDQ